MNNFSVRSDEKEIMDDLHCGGEVINQTLRELETINKWLGGNSVTINGLNQLVKKKQVNDRVIKIADIGCGGGDMMVLMAKWARKKQIQVELIGIDANPNIIAYAESNTQNYPEISYSCMDIFSNAFKALNFDIITSTLFTHHFSDGELSSMLGQWLGQANLGLVINDLHRHWFAYHSIKLLTTLFSKSAMVKNDAAVSVMRSFRKKDIESILGRAGLQPVSLRWMWAFRWQLIIE